MDSLKLARRLSLARAEETEDLPVLIEVNVSGEASKYGLSAGAWAADPAQRENLLATAAEINFHHNQPDVAFFAACVERGVKITFGSDAHDLYEAGLLGAHLALLRQAAATPDIADLLL